MEARLYFVLGDCLGNALVGAFSGWAAVAWMPHALGFWLCTHEVMVPTMIGGMTANMTVCALAHHHAMSPLDGAWLGALIGLGVLLLTYIANARMTREA